MTQLLPFRSKTKVKALINRGLVEPAYHIDSYPVYLYQPMPKYIAKKQRPGNEYKHIHGDKTWMVDIAFISVSGEVIQAATEEQVETLAEEHPREIKIVLICIQCNSRFVAATIIPDRRADTLYPYIKQLTDQLDCPCDTIISDDDASLASAIASIPAIKKGRHIAYNMSNTKYTIHSLLAPIDRFTRTLRDMLFNCKLPLDNTLLKRLIRIYNYTPHSTLSRVMGFAVTPKDMLSNIKLQHEFMRRIQAYNTNVFDTINDEFKKGDIVYVYQPPQPFGKRRNTVEDYPYVIVDNHGGRYTLRNTRTNVVIERPRSYLVRLRE